MNHDEHDPDAIADQKELEEPGEEVNPEDYNLDHCVQQCYSQVCKSRQRVHIILRFVDGRGHAICCLCSHSQRWFK